MGFTCAPSVTGRAVVSYTALPPLPRDVYRRCGTVSPSAVHFCCTVPGVTSAGRYPASCPVKPGLSSPGPFRLSGSGRLSHLRAIIYHTPDTVSRGAGIARAKHCRWITACGRVRTVADHRCSAHQTSNVPPPMNSLISEFLGISSAGIGRK